MVSFDFCFGKVSNSRVRDWALPRLSGQSLSFLWPLTEGESSLNSQISQNGSQEIVENHGLSLLLPSHGFQFLLLLEGLFNLTCRVISLDTQYTGGLLPWGFLTGVRVIIFNVSRRSFVCWNLSLPDISRTKRLLISWQVSWFWEAWRSWEIFASAFLMDILSLGRMLNSIENASFFIQIIIESCLLYRLPSRDVLPPLVLGSGYP